MNKEIFRKIGLTNKETEVYLALLELGQSAIGNILKKTNVSSSKVYSILNRLAKKGLVSEVLKGKMHYYSAAPPQRLLDYLEEKKRDLTVISNEMEAALPQLDLMYNMAERQEAKVYIGYNGLRTAFDTILQTLKSGEGYVGFLATVREQSDPITKNLFVKYHQRRYEKGIHARLLGGMEMKRIFSQEPYRSYRLFKIRYMPQQTLSNILIFKDNVFLYTGVGSPIGFILTSKNLADMLRRFFHYSWKISRV